MWRENAAWVKGLGGGVWLVARKRRLGQESRWRSVACGEKTPRGSRKPVVQCGLWRENAAWVKKAGGGVWLVARKRRVGQESRWCSVACGEKTPPGSRKPVAECGLGGRICCLGQEGRRCSVVCGEKTPRGSRKPAAECGLWRENAAWVKKAGGVVWSRRANLSPGSRRPVAECGLGGQTSYLGQRTWRCSVVCGEKTPPGSRKPVV